MYLGCRAETCGHAFGAGCSFSLAASMVAEFRRSGTANP